MQPKLQNEVTIDNSPVNSYRIPDNRQIKVKFHYTLSGRRQVRAGRRHAASWNLAYHLSS